MPLQVFVENEDPDSQQGLPPVTKTINLSRRSHMHCINCESEIKADWVACPECGVPVNGRGKTCRACGRVVATNWTLCPDCGQGAESPDKPGSTLVQDSVVKNFNQATTHAHHKAGGATIGGSIHVNIGKSSIRGLKADDVVECPFDGRKRLRRETFRCRVCGQDHLCLEHLRESDGCCERCASELAREREADERRRNPALASREHPWENSLGMKFVPVPGTNVLFCIWQTRVSDYAAFVSANDDVNEAWRSPVYHGQPVTPSEDCPVANVTWAEARRFCHWLSRKEQTPGQLGQQHRYRLPTDEEWSWAVEIGDYEKGETPQAKDGKLTCIYPWGSDWPPPRNSGNYPDECAGRTFKEWKVIEGYDDGFVTTAPVGSFSANTLGLYDLGGNVWEWCEDFYDGRSGLKVLRGGAWGRDLEDGLLSSSRGTNDPISRRVNVGFRCVLELPRWLRRE